MAGYSVWGILVRTILWFCVGISYKHRICDNEIEVIKLEVERLKSENEILRKRLKGKKNKRHTWQEKLHILWHMEVFKIPRRKVNYVFGIARSTYYRWLRKAEDGTLIDNKKYYGNFPPNKTKDDLVELVWNVFDSNPNLGRERISNIMGLLGVFLSPSAVRNVLRRGKPNKKSPEEKEAPNPVKNNVEYPGIIAMYPNHIWSIDLCVVKRWFVWTTYVLIAIDHYSRKTVCVKPLEGPNAGWSIDALEEAFERYGKPKHIISDQGSIFTSDAFKELMDKWDIKHRFGAIGKHGSIAVTERVIKTFKYEWLDRVIVVKGFEYLNEICKDFEEWYNLWRPHSRLYGGIPDDVFYKRSWKKPSHDAKKIPSNIETKHFRESRITGFRLKKAA